MITNPQSRTRIDEIVDGIYRISTPLPPGAVPGGFQFNQFLVTGDQPLLFHTGPRAMFPLTRDAIATVLPVDRLAFVGFSHFESDECGALNAFLAAAPQAKPLCGNVNALINADAFDRAPQALGDGQVLSLGKHRVRWFDTPHLPHAWECGYLYEEQTRTLLCGDLFTQGGDDTPPITEGDILSPSERFREQMDYYAHGRAQAAQLERLAATGPQTLACMHGSAWKGDGAALLRELAQRLAQKS